MSKEIKLSIIIVNYNVKEFLRNCINSICASLTTKGYEIIVIDNNSSDNSVEMLKNEFPQVKLIENKENRGFAAANNQGISISKGRYILLLNPDTIVLPNALDTMMAFLDSHPKVGALGCRILNPDGTLQSSCRNFPSLLMIFFENIALYKLFSKSRVISKYYLRYWDHNKNRAVDWVLGACLMVRREVIDMVGLLDENFFMYGEDADWCKRINKQGWEVFFIPEAQIIHYGSQSSKLQQVQNLIELHKSRQLFFKKHYGRITASLGRIIYGLGVFLRLMSCISLFVLTGGEERTKERLRVFSAIFRWYIRTSKSASQLR